MTTIEKLKEEIAKLPCLDEEGDWCNLDGLVCDNCAKRELIEAKLSQYIENGEEFKNILIKAYKKCSEELIKIKSQKPREDNQPRDWYNRLDELRFLYSQLRGISINKAEEELKSSLEKEDGGEVKDKNDK